GDRIGVKCRRRVAPGGALGRTNIIATRNQNVAFEKQYSASRVTPSGRFTISLGESCAFSIAAIGGGLWIRSCSPVTCALPPFTRIAFLQEGHINSTSGCVRTPIAAGPGSAAHSPLR